MGELYHHLTYNDRLKIEALLLAKTPKKEIAKIIGVHISTIYREVKRGTYIYTVTVIGLRKKDTVRSRQKKDTVRN